MYAVKPVFLSDCRLLWLQSASVSLFFYPPVFVERKTKITFLLSMLWCLLPARRIRQRWGATREHRGGGTTAGRPFLALPAGVEDLNGVAVRHSGESE
jgi:hypothetical protein